MDKGNGQLLKSYKGHTNKDFRIRSCLGMADAIVVSGSEDGHLYAWDLLDGKVIYQSEAHSGKVASAVAWNGTRKEWASAGTDGTDWRRHVPTIVAANIAQVLFTCGACQHRDSSSRIDLTGLP